MTMTLAQAYDVLVGFYDGDLVQVKDDCIIREAIDLLGHHARLQDERMTYNPNCPLVAIDFDGVIHSYVSGWKGVDVIPDPPMPGAIDWLEALVLDEFNVQIFSARCNDPEGIETMYRWFAHHGMNRELLDCLTFMPGKPKAHLIIDDRAWRFAGMFPSPQEIKDFKPYRIKDHA